MEHPLSLPLHNHIYILLDPHAAASQALQLIATLSVNSPTVVLDCGNRSQMYTVARHLRRLTADPVAALNRIRLSRAFTCHQVREMILHAPITPSCPVIILDFLSTFFDDEVKPPEASWLLQGCLTRLLEIKELAPVLITARPTPAMAPEKTGLMDLLTAIGTLYETSALHPSAGPVQPELF